MSGFPWRQAEQSTKPTTLVGRCHLVSPCLGFDRPLGRTNFCISLPLPSLFSRSRATTVHLLPSRRCPPSNFQMRLAAFSVEIPPGPSAQSRQTAKSDRNVGRLAPARLVPSNAGHQVPSTTTASLSSQMAACLFPLNLDPPGAGPTSRPESERASYQHPSLSRSLHLSPLPSHFPETLRLRGLISPFTRFHDRQI